MTSPAPRPSPLRSALPALLLAAAALLLLAAAARLNRGLLRTRADLHLTQAPPTENLPPAEALVTIALGGFRGLLADALWIRATDLQDKGRYFELVQLATWITRLQPRSPAVWAFHAWNLAYNIPSLMPDPDAKWPWIRSAIRLLQDDAATSCPASPVIHRELAWIFLHKLGTDIDPAAPRYRAEWAPLAAECLAARTPPFDPATVADARRLVAPLSDDDLLLPQAAAILHATYALSFDPPPPPAEDVFLRRIAYQSLFQLIDAGRRDLIPYANAYVRDTAARHPSNPALQSLLLRLPPDPAPAP